MRGRLDCGVGKFWGSMMGLSRLLCGSASVFRQASGATAIEYGLIAGLIGISLYVVLGIYFDSLTNLFNYIIAAMSTV